MLDFKNVQKHVKRNLKEYEARNLDEKGRWINQGWDEALLFVERNYNLTEKTMKGD